MVAIISIISSDHFVVGHLPYTMVYAHSKPSLSLKKAISFAKFLAKENIVVTCLWVVLNAMHTTCFLIKQEITLAAPATMYALLNDAPY